MCAVPSVAVFCSSLLSCCVIIIIIIIICNRPADYLPDDRRMDIKNSHIGDWQGEISLPISNHSRVTLPTTNPPWNSVVRNRDHALSNCLITVGVMTQRYWRCFRRNLPYFRRTIFKSNLRRYNQTHSHPKFTRDIDESASCKDRELLYIYWLPKTY